MKKTEDRNGYTAPRFSNARSKTRPLFPIAKQNYGDSGSASLIFDAKFNRFKNISDFYAEAL